MKPFFSHICWTSKAISLVIKTAAVPAQSGQQPLRQEQMAAKKKSSFFFIYLFFILKKLEKDSRCPIFYECLGRWKKYGWGKAEDGKAPSCQEAWMRKRTLEYTSYACDFQYAISSSAADSSCPPLPSFVFGVKVPPSQKSQILYDRVEIALSKMQSAKAAWSADELPRLRGRQ